MAYGGKSESEQRSIIAQSSGNAAAVIYAGIAGGSEWDPLLYNTIRKEIFNGTLGLIGVQTGLEHFEPTNASAETPVVASSNGNGPGGFVLEFGQKHKGKTIAAIYAEDPTYVSEFLAEKTKHAPTKNAAQKFLALYGGVNG